MKPTRHILSIWLLSVLLSLWAVPLWADDALMGGLHCGDVVTITATPDPGYRFSHWSDGNTDNPREIEMSDAVNLTAVYEPVCKDETVPVVWLYDQLMMVNVNSMQSMGYIFSEQSVTWYRIVGDIDVTSSQSDDQVLGTGYYYNLSPDQKGAFYAAVDVSATPPGSQPRCSDMLYSQPILKGMTALDDVIDQPILLVPNYVSPGEPMQLVGLQPSQHYTVQIYDAVGRKLEEYALAGEQQYTVTAQSVPGYYMVKVISKHGELVLKYVVKK